eukprot:TRINITY_DN6670_c0_g1_i3.p1 TRINITY_DN6670_c0_g1~~TRINITY_DN6670_c0_g1_i3.p1  ORF type:complete len:204 (+),score=45.96 TRINITY_DN6670_c0_g1_i3:178-789(+)
MLYSLQFLETIKLHVSSHVTIQFLKLMIYEKMDVPPLRQKLFYHQQELDNPRATLLDCGVLSASTILLEISDKDVVPAYFESWDPSIGENYEAELGFDGTLLNHSQDLKRSKELSKPPSPLPPSSPLPQSPPSLPLSLPSPPLNGVVHGWLCLECSWVNDDKQSICSVCSSSRQWCCTQCTLHNPSTLSKCEICSAPKPKPSQ